MWSGFPTMLEMNHPTVTVQVSEETAANYIGKKYAGYCVSNRDRRQMNRAINEVTAMNDILIDRLQEEISVKYTSDDPYSSHESMCYDIDENDRIKIFDAGTHPWYMGDSEKSAKQNNIENRAIHDYFGHYKKDVGFNFWGEFQKWHHMRKHYSRQANRALFNEVAGQTGLIHYIDGGFESDEYQQKAFLAPEHWIEYCYEHCPHRLGGAEW